MVLAEHGPAPGQAHPDPGRQPSGIGLSERDLQPVDGEQPEEEQGTVGQGERRGRQPVIARDIEGKGRQEARPWRRSIGSSPVPEAMSSPPKSTMKPIRSAQADARVADKRQTRHFDPRHHRRMVVIAQSRVGRIQESDTPHRFLNPS